MKYGVWEGSTAEFFELRDRAREAGALINEANIDYSIIDPFRDAQNSNSVVGTLMTAMKLEIPREAEAVWAPGINRHLLASDFKSYFDFFPITNENFAEFLPKQGSSSRDGMHYDYTEKIFSPLYIGNVAESVKAIDPPEDDEPTRFFRSKDEKTPSDYGMNAAHNFMHENNVGHHHGNNHFKHSH